MCKIKLIYGDTSVILMVELIKSGKKKEPKNFIFLFIHFGERFCKFLEEWSSSTARATIVGMDIRFIY